jgi:hypothetical protein
LAVVEGAEFGGSEFEGESNVEGVQYAAEGGGGMVGRKLLASSEDGGPDGRLLPEEARGVVCGKGSNGLLASGRSDLPPALNQADG